MIEHKNTLLTLGGLIAIGALAACGGGNSASGTPTALPSSGQIAHATQSTGTRITFTINRAKPAARKHAAARRTSAKRGLEFVSANTSGAQIAITSGSATTTVYADVSASGLNCSGIGGNSQTCSVVVPTLGSNETIVLTTVDETPTGDANGYGTGFPTNTNVLGIGTATVTPTPGAITTVNMTVDPVVGDMYDCGIIQQYAGSVAEDGGGGWQNQSNANFARLVVTAGTATNWAMQPTWADRDETYPGITLPSPEPFVDVNGTPQPETIVSSSSHLTLFAAPNGAPLASPAPSPGPYTQTLSLPDTSFANDSGCFWIYFNYDGSAPAGTTVTLSNNLAATPPWAGSISSPTYGITLVYLLAPVGVVSPSTNALSLSFSGTTATVVGTDYGATNGMSAGSSASNYADGNCYDTLNTSTADATITSGSSISTTTWQQSFTVTATGTPPAMGTTETCVFSLSDTDTRIPSPPITVTLSP
jgi:hypothetical protein